MAIREAPQKIVTFDSLEAFLETPETPNGTFTVTVGGLPIDFDYEDRGYSTTVIFFQAAIGPKVKILPVFLGKTFSQNVPANRLFVSDPTLYVSKRLSLAWYAGSMVQPNLQAELSLIFSKVSGPNRPIYFGTSGGGFAALAFSALHDGSLAVAVNPQTNIADYQPAAVVRWTNVAWNMDNVVEGPFSMPPVTTNLRPVYAQKLTNHVVYVQNTGDTSHMSRQWMPFKESVHPENSLFPVIEFSGPGHVAPPSKYLSALLSTVARSSSWRDLDLSDLGVSPLRPENGA